jgi:hypothetical protein
MRRPLILLATVVIAFAVAPGRARTALLPSGAQDQKEPAATEAERQALITRTLANQNADDEALQLFQRVERRIIHDRDMSSNAGEDRTVRIIPTGAGSARVTLAEHGRPAEPTAIHSQMLITERMLEAAADSTNPQTKRDREKIERRSRDRRDLVNAIRDAFVFTWMGREVRQGRTVAKYHLDPNPNYKPTSIKTEYLRHATATAWVDEKSAQLVRLDAVLVTDISFIGGIAGKVYKDGHAVIEQSEVEPGVWLPTLYQYDFTVRKFLFNSEIHERVEASQYKRIGPPAQALTAIRREMATTPPPHSQQ